MFSRCVEKGLRNAASLVKTVLNPDILRFWRVSFKFKESVSVVNYIYIIELEKQASPQN